MPGIGTIINMVTIIVGGLIGLVVKNHLSTKFQETLMAAMSICILFIGMSGAIKESLSFDGAHFTINGTMMTVISFLVGTVIGEILDLDDKLEKFGAWLKIKSHNEGEGGFIAGFLTASFTVCIGAMAIIGAIQDAYGDASILIAKATMDGIVIMIMTASLGKGCMYSAIPVGIVQGIITLLAIFIEQWLTPSTLSNISLTGSLLIFLVGVNLLWDKHIRIANMLPVIVIAALWSWL